jgi:hypothetical protein
MNNVNDILKRQLLLMKFDSGVTLKENHEKVLGLINENDNNLWYSAIGKIKNASNWSNNFGSDSWEVNTDDSSKYEVEVDSLTVNDMAINVSMEEKLPGFLWFDSMEAEVSKKNGNWNFDGNNFIVTVEGLSITKPTFQESVYHIMKYFYPSQMSAYDKPSELSAPKQEAANPAAGSSGAGKQGWDMGKAMAKYPCLSGSDLAWRDVMSDDHGDVIKLNIGKTREGGQIYARLYLQDGYMNQWDYPYGRIGGENQYAVCRNYKLSFQTGKNTSMTDASTGKPQMESVNKFGKLIKEAIDLEVINAAGGVGGSGTGDNTPRAPRTPRPKVDKSSLVKEVQNKLKELDPTAVVSGTMDQETINKIMLQINKLVEKQNSEAEAKRKEDERVAAIQTVNNNTSSHDI